MERHRCLFVAVVVALLCARFFQFLIASRSAPPIEVPALLQGVHPHRPSSQRAILALARGICFRGHDARTAQYEGLTPILGVWIDHSGRVMAADPRETVHQSRACEILHSLDRVLRQTPAQQQQRRQRALGRTGRALALFLHDGCPSDPKLFNVTILSYGVMASACPWAAPLPWVPSEHNPAWSAPTPQHTQTADRTASAGVASASARLLGYSRRISDTYPWESKRPLAAWRGSASDASSLLWRSNTSRKLRGSNRGRLALKALTFPYHIDAALTRSQEIVEELNGQGSTVAVRLGDARAVRPFEWLFGHKYVIDVAGKGSSFRLPSLLLGNSVVIRQAGWVHWFSQLTDKATVEARADLEDIIPIVEKLREDDAGARLMAERMQRAARRAFVEESTPGAGSDAQREAWMWLLQWLGEAEANHDANPGVERGAAMEAAGFMRPLGDWVASGVCHDPRSKPKEVVRFYPRRKRHGRAGVDYRRKRTTCVKELTIDA